MRYIYLHGFASGPQSRKAQAFRAAVSESGIPLEIPDLAQGDFPHLTITGQLGVVERVLKGEACCLIGSSMGGYLAAIYAAAHPEAARLVLLAPAFAFATRWRQMQDRAAVARWRETGWTEVFHYGDQAMRPIHYGLLEDAANYPAFPDFQQPGLIFHGTNDAVVPVAFSREFAAGHPNTRLVEVASDHELLDVQERMIREAVQFLSLGAGF